jgi:hypothetical protein
MSVIRNRTEALEFKDGAENISSSMTSSFAIPEIDPTMQHIITDPKSEFPQILNALLAGKVECGHIVPMAEHLGTDKFQNTKRRIPENANQKF